MRKFLLINVLIGWAFLGLFRLSATAQVANNMTLLSNWDNNSLPNASGVVYNDIWGYVDGNGREYAILGTISGFFVFDITVPTSPVQISFHPGGSASSIWRDFKTYGNYLYAISDQGTASSLQVFDLSTLPASVTKVYDSQAFFTTAHNLFVEPTSGRLYVAGSNTSPNGINILDIGTNPAAPQQFPFLPPNGALTLGGYIHDIYVRNDTLYTFNGNGGFAVFNFAGNNPGTWAQIGQMNTYPEQGYAHSGWCTDDHNYLIHADETHNTGLKITDVANHASMNVVTTFRSALLGPANTASIVHNPYVNGNYVYVAYYHDGVQVFDITNPAAPAQVAGYDTDPTNTNYNGYDGCWGLYPYLPSGNIIASDTRFGLFVLSPVTMPVEFTAFEAELDNGRVFLEWETGSESNNEKFLVQRSPDGLEWESLDEIAGAGFTQNNRHYSAVDESPLEGDSWYRIKQVDYDGQSTYSEIRRVSLEPRVTLFSVFPNPAISGELLNINLGLDQTSEVSIQVIDLMGRTVYQTNKTFSEGSHVLPLNTPLLPAGHYKLMLESASGREIQSFIISR